MKNNTCHQAGRDFYNQTLNAGIAMITRITPKKNRWVHMSLFFPLVLFDTQSSALRVFEKEPALEWDYKYNFVGRKECLRRKYDRDVRSVKTGRSEVQK